MSEVMQAQVEPKRQSFLHSVFWVLAISNTANLLNYVSSVVLGRSISPEDFGVFNSVNSLGQITLTASVVLPYLGSKYFIKFQQDRLKQISFAHGFIRMCWAIGVITGVSLLLFSPLVASFLQLSELTPTIIFGACGACAYFYTGMMGLQMGTGRYVLVNLQSFSLALFKLLGFLMFITWLGYSYNAALLVVGLVNLGTGYWMWQSFRRYLPHRPIGRGTISRAEKKDMAIYVLPILLNTLGISVLTNVDIILVKHYFPEDVSGFYSGAALLGRIAFFLPSMLMSVVFPEVVRASEQGLPPIKIVSLSLGMIALVSGAFVIFTDVFGQQLLTATFGDTYKQGAQVLSLLALAMSFLAVVSMCGTIFLAQNDYRYLVPLYAGLVLGIGAVVVSFHGAITEVAASFAVGIGFSALGCVILLLLKCYGQVKALKA